MAEPRSAEPKSTPAPVTSEDETTRGDASRKANDPGGAHTKGYTADPPGDPAGTHPDDQQVYPLAEE